MARRSHVIEADEQAELARMKSLNDEIRTIETKLGNGASSPGLDERLGNLKRGVESALERHAELVLERRDSIMEDIKSGRVGFEAGCFGGTDSYLSGGAPIDAARRRVDALCKSGGIPDHAAEIAERLLTKSTGPDQDLAARWTITAGDPDYLSAFVKLLADPNRGHMLWNGREHEAYKKATTVAAELKAASLSDPAGGFMVPFTLDPTILLTSAGSVNPLRQISRIAQTVTDNWNGVTSAGVTAEWLAEAAQAADASPTLAQPTIPVFKGSAFIPYSYEVGMDAVNFAQEMTNLLVDAADQLQASAYMSGNGTTQPFGLTTTLPAGSKVNTATADVLVGNDVIGLQNALPPRFQPRARWIANLTTINKLAGLETTNGALRFPELADDRLLRKPISEASALATTGATAGAGNDPIMVYGDFSNFIIVDRIGTFVEPITNLFGANQRPTGQRGLFMWFRTGSDSVVDNAFRMLMA